MADCKARRSERRGASLMEVMATVALSAVLMTPMINLLLTSHSTWEGVDGDATRRWAADATARHVASHLINAIDIVGISEVDANAGALAIRTFDGRTLKWRQDGGQILLSDGQEEPQLVSRGITRLQFIGYTKGGFAQTKIPLQIEMVECVVHTQLTNKRDYVARRKVRLRKLPRGLLRP